MLRPINLSILIIVIFAASLFAQAPGGVSGNIQLWLRADTGAVSGGSPAGNGDAVNTWEDQSGSRTNDASSANLDPPNFRDNSTDNLNFNPIIEFDGLADGLDFGTDYVYSPGTNTGMHWFAVLKPNTEINKTRQKIVDFGLYADFGYGFSYGSEAYGFYTSNNTGQGGDITADQPHSMGTDATLVSFQIDFGDEQKMSFNGSSVANNQAITLTQLTAANINESGTHMETFGPVTIGHQSKTQNVSSDGGRRYSGAIAEIIGYSDTLTNANKNKVETYLAIKYGLSIEHNYIADISGADSTIYDISSYSNNIAGVGQDSVDQAFKQLVSRSITDGSLVTGSITEANIDDEEYVVWGHDGASTTLGTTFNDLPNTRITRIWKVKETGTVGSMTISIPTSVAGGLTALVVANTPTITQTSDLDGSYALTVNGSNYEASVTFSGTQYFTFITTTSGGIKYPGGISSNLQLWLKANAGAKTGGSDATNGTAVNTWEDQAGSNDATDTNLDAPTYRDNTNDNLNNNPVIEFDGTADGLDLGPNYIFAPSGGLTWFAVVEPNPETSKTRQRVVDFGQYDEAGYGFSYGSETYGFYTSTSAGGAATTDHAHSRDTIPTLVSFQVDFSNNQEIAFNGSTPDSIQTISLTGLPDANINQSSTHDTASGPVTIGQQSQTNNISSNGGRYFSGKIAEIVGYDAVISSTNKNRVETYLALKYGLTLGHNYIADVNGNTTIYIISGYSNDIAGVGKDISNQDFSQLSSKSENIGSLITGTIADANLDDDEYIIWGNDGGSDTLTATFEGLANTRLGRIWKVTETGSAGSMTISIPTSVSPVLTFLVVSNSSTISSTSDLTGSYALSTVGSNYQATVNFSGTQYFSFISSTPGGTTFPGGVSSELAFWLNAKEGALNSSGYPASDNEEVVTWNDVSGNVIKNNATDTNLDAPDYRDSLLNFNPVVEFNGTTDGLDLGGNYIFSQSSKSGMQWFAVVEPNSETGKTRQRIVDFGEYTDFGYGFSYGSEAYGFYTSTDATYGGGDVTVDQTHSNGTNPILVNFDIEFDNAQRFSLNGTQITSQPITLSSLVATNIGENSTHIADAGPVTIGQQSMTTSITLNGGRRFSGKMAEVICYSASLSSTDKNKVETYLAIKYGLILGHNYIASINDVNTTIYDTTGYSYDIAGVGQDKIGQGLDQRKSKSVNSGSLLTISVPDANIDDEEYVVWGNDAASDTLTETFEGEANTRLGRIWKVTETGSVGSMTVSIPVSVAPDLTFLIKSNTSTISTVDGLAGAYALTINGSNYEATVAFSNNGTQYFTFTSSTDERLPVYLTSFTAESVNGGVELKWVTESEVDNAGFEVWRSIDSVDNFIMIASYINNSNLVGAGNSSQRKEYSFLDKSVEEGNTYAYKLSDVDFSGERTFHETITVTVTGQAPKEYILYTNYPNPFNPSTKIRYYIPANYSGKKVTMKVYNIIGQLVKTLLDKEMESGVHTVTWNGKNESGVKLASGIYFLEMKAENFRRVQKMMIIK